MDNVCSNSFFKKNNLHMLYLSSRIQRGFEGVMKRHGFHGMPATHGQTKTHRRPGCIGRGRNYGVQPGKKLPGHVGFRWRTTRGIEVKPYYVL